VKLNRRTLLLLCLIAPAALTFAPLSAGAAQTGHIVGYLVARETGEPLAYGIVGVEATSRSAFTSDSGWFSVRELTPGQHLLRVRRLGFTPRDISFVVRDGITDTLRVELTRVAVRLGAVDVKAYPPCLKPGAPIPQKDSSLAVVVEQIRLNAEQFKFLADQYPYWYLMVVKRSSKLRRDGSIRPDPGSLERYESNSKSVYEPGAIIQRDGREWRFRTPTLVEVADPAFANSHCWHYGGMEEIEDEPVIRVDVVAFDSLKGPDVNGSFFVSSRTFQIRRSILHLSRPPTQVPGVMNMEVTAEFFEVLPSISVVSKIRGVQTVDPKRRSLVSEMYEEQTASRFAWLKESPEGIKSPQPDQTKPRPPAS
jgi:hypothetical protein